jgi:hypothetical protein
MPEGMRRVALGLLVTTSSAAPLSMEEQRSARSASLQPVNATGVQRRLVDILNERFMNGRPSDVMREAGVIVHQFDDSGFDTSTRRLREGGVAQWSPWTPCPVGQWCSKFGDRFSVSVINARVPFAFNEYNGGLLINPEVAHEGTFCAWATDARSFRSARSCLPNGTHFRWGDGAQLFERREGCIPGCVNGVAGQLEDWDTVMHDQLSPTWCSPDAPDGWCPWHPEHLKRMLEQQERGFLNTDCAQNNGCRYNEIVLNSSVWEDQLPHTVEAIFHLKGSAPSGAALAQSHKAHYDFLSQYDLTDAHVPLFELDLLSVTGAGPFREIKNHLLRGTKYASES